jgi:hypothetical protein
MVFPWPLWQLRQWQLDPAVRRNVGAAFFIEKCFNKKVFIENGSLAAIHNMLLLQQ